MEHSRFKRQEALIYLTIAKNRSQIFCDYKIFIVITINQNSIIGELYLNNKTNVDLNFKLE